MTTEINKSQITTIITNFSSLNSSYKYKKKTGFWIFTKPAGFYWDYFREFITTEEELVKSGNYYVKDNKVYYNPHLTIKLTDGQIRTLWFKTEQEMLDYKEQLKEGNHFIEEPSNNS
jgi:hypothetical protein